MKECTLFHNIDIDSEFYFVHSYYVQCSNSDHVLCRTQYGINFDSGFVKGNITGFQFHPEKSHQNGLMILKNFFGD